MESALTWVLRRWGLCETWHHWMLMLMKHFILQCEQWNSSSASVFILGPLVSRNDLSQIKEFLKYSSCVLSEKNSNLKITSARERKGKDDKFAFTLTQSAVSYPVWWHCRGQIHISQSLSSVSPVSPTTTPILLSPSCSAAASLRSERSDHGSDVAWSEGKVRIPPSASG